MLIYHIRLELIGDGVAHFESIVRDGGYVWDIVILIILDAGDSVTFPAIHQRFIVILHSLFQQG